MYPLKLLCKQYTKQSLSEILSEGISPFSPLLPCDPLLWLFQARASGKSTWGDTKGRAAILLWSHVLMIRFWRDREARRLPRAGASASLLSLSWQYFLFSLSLSIQEAIYIPSAHLPAPHFPRDPPYPAHQTIP